MTRLCRPETSHVAKLAVGITVLTFLCPSAKGQSTLRRAEQLQRRQAPTQTFHPGQVNLANSRAYIFVGKTGLGHEHGVEGRIQQGMIHLGVEQNAGQLIFDMTTFQADTDQARRYVGLGGATDEATRRKVNANMLGADVLDVRNYPTATFAIQSSRPLPNKSQRGLPQYRLDGTFTLHGVTRPVSITADAEQKGGWLHLRGGFAILQSDYKMTPFSKAFGAVGVTDQLKIWGDLWIAGPEVTAAAAPTARTR